MGIKNHLKTNLNSLVFNDHKAALLTALNVERKLESYWIVNKHKR